MATTFDPPPQVDKKVLPIPLQDWMRRFYLFVLAAPGLGGIVDMAHGGTNNTVTPPIGRIIYSDGTKLISDANLTWDATTGLLVKKNISCPIGANHGEAFGAGVTAHASSVYNTLVGSGVSGGTISTHYYNTIIGASAQATAGFSTVIGAQAASFSDGGIAIGTSASTSGPNAIAIGNQSAVGNHASAIAIGQGHVINHAQNTLLGDSGLTGRDNELGFGQATVAGGGAGFRLWGGIDAVFFISPYDMFRIGTVWTDSTEATRKARVSFYVYDTAEREFMRADSTGAAAVNVAFLSGGSLITQAAALGTTATDGFIYIPTSAGAPSGTPTAQTGTVATEYDTTNNALKIYNSAWKTIPVPVSGSWTPADNSGAALTFTGVSANYTKIGNMVFAYFKLTYPATASGANASISGLPFTIANADYATGPAIVDTSASITGGLVLVPVKNTTTANLDVGTPVGPVTNLQLSGASVAVMLIYPVT